MTERGLSAPVAALLRQAEQVPDRVAVITGDEGWTVSRLADQSNRLAAGMAEHGVKPGDRVALHMHNVVEAALTYLACLRLGAVAMPLNTRLALPELQDLIRRTEPAIYLGQQELHARLVDLPQNLLPDSARFVVGPSTASASTRTWEDLQAAGAGAAGRELAEAPSDPESPAILLATSGTTGRSKIVIWSYRTLAALHLSAAGRGITAGGVVPVATPLMHGGAVCYLFSLLTQAATAILTGQFNAAVMLDSMQRHQVTTVYGMPFMCAELAREQRSRPRDVSALQSATVVGDVCPAEVEIAFQEVFGVPLLSFWAATEDVGATVTWKRTGPYLRLIPDAHAEITAADGRPVAPGETGEMVTRSPTTSPGYWDGPRDHTLTPEGGFRSGDLVREVGPGVLQYMGRKKDLIVRGGSNVSPGEVEEALRAHPDVLDAAVAGYEDGLLGQRVGALLVVAGRPRHAVLAADIRAWAGEHLASYKVPERIAFVDALPRNALTKVDRLAVGSALTALSEGEESPRA